jgi:hypothetical protein
MCVNSHSSFFSSKFPGGIKKIILFTFLDLLQKSANKMFCFAQHDSLSIYARGLLHNYVGVAANFLRYVENLTRNP